MNGQPYSVGIATRVRREGAAARRVGVPREHVPYQDAQHMQWWFQGWDAEPDLGKAFPAGEPLGR